MKVKMRSPTESDKQKAREWLFMALHALDHNEYHRIKRVCRQVIRVLRRKETEPKDM